MYRYKNKKTGKIIERVKPLSREKAQDYTLMSYIKNMLISTGKVLKK